MIKLKIHVYNNNIITICHGDAAIFFGSIRKENIKQRAVK
jgi:hypothetical protein